MQHISTAPFGRRPVTAGLMASVQVANQPPALPKIDKWYVFRELCVARKAFGLSDRDLSVLNALLTFLKSSDLADNDRLVVFPSNATLSTRAHGMAESTLRRHIAALVKAGIILRHDSPNGKRYAAKRSDGQIIHAYGFSLRPLLVRALEITECADEARADLERMRLLRHEITVMKRDALKLAQYGAEAGIEEEWQTLMADLFDVHKALRRKLSYAALTEIAAKVADILACVRRKIDHETPKESANDSQNERHYKSSNKEYLDSGKETVRRVHPFENSETEDQNALKTEVALSEILRACPDISPYSRHDIRHWHELVGLSEMLRTMMGIQGSVWKSAKDSMGQEASACVMACMLQRAADIRNPTGYLKKLTAQFREGVFELRPMVVTLLNAGAKS